MKYGKTAIIFSTIILLTASISAQTGGDFTITQSVIAAGGGQNAAGGAFSLDGTIGQSVAGGASGNPPFSLTSGFWNFSPLAPTAANASVSGRIMTPDGGGIRNVRVTLTAPDGQTRTAQTGTFGFYRFEGVPVGEIYVLTVHSKRFTFSPPSQIITLLDELTELNFTALPQ